RKKPSVTAQTSRRPSLLLSISSSANPFGGSSSYKVSKLLLAVLTASFTSIAEAISCIIDLHLGLDAAVSIGRKKAPHAEHARLLSYSSTIRSELVGCAEVAGGAVGVVVA